MLEPIVLVIHLMLAVAIIALVLLQQSAGGGLGIGGGGGGMGGLATARGTANLLTRLTTLFAIMFMCTSLGLAILAKKKVAAQPASILDLAEDDAAVDKAVPAEVESAIDEAKEAIKDVPTPTPDKGAAPAVPISE